MPASLEVLVTWLPSDTPAPPIIGGVLALPFCGFEAIDIIWFMKVDPADVVPVLSGSKLALKVFVELCEC